MTPPHEVLSVKLGEFLTRETGGIARVKVLQRLAGGASRAAFALDIEIGGGPWKGRRAAVLRLDLGGRIYDASLERVEELQVISHAERGGVPVPRPLWASIDGTILGRGFLLLERVEGETIGRKIVQLPDLAEARRLLPGELGKALARIHALDPAPLEFLPRPRARGSPGAWAPALDACERARVEMDRAGGTYPGLEAGLRWLEAHAPAAEEVVLVHGDFRLGNIIVGPEGLRAVIDWEFAQVGDPHEDLAWPFVRDWRFGMDSLRFAGLSDGADFLAAYEEESGRRVDRARLRYWEALGNLRWAVGCLSQARRHTSGVEPSVELASLGRRSAEMELEMLDRIEDMALERGG